MELSTKQRVNFSFSKKVYPQNLVVHSTVNTLTTLHEFKAALELIRKQGYAIEDEEGEIGVRCIAAPIYNDQNKLTAAISITSLRTELPIQEISTVGNQVKKTALLISSSLGYNKDHFPETVQG